MTAALQLSACGRAASCGRQKPFALHFLLQGAKRLFNIVVSDNDLHIFSLRMMSWGQFAWQILGIRSATIAQSKAALDGRSTRSCFTTALHQRGCNVC
jgi:hypothetical protein